jgi:hypothetical protein
MVEFRCGSFFFACQIRMVVNREAAHIFTYLDIGPHSVNLDIPSRIVSTLRVLLICLKPEWRKRFSVSGRNTQHKGLMLHGIGWEGTWISLKLYGNRVNQGSYRR